MSKKENAKKKSESGYEKMRIQSFQKLELVVMSQQLRKIESTLIEANYMK